VNICPSNDPRNLGSHDSFVVTDLSFNIAEMLAVVSER
jgi:hypothetical protein